MYVIEGVVGYGINIIGTIDKYEEALLFSSLYYYTRGHVIHIHGWSQSHFVDFNVKHHVNRFRFQSFFLFYRI